jgi:hypothetical protein
MTYGLCRGCQQYSNVYQHHNARAGCPAINRRASPCSEQPRKLLKPLVRPTRPLPLMACRWSGRGAFDYMVGSMNDKSHRVLGGIWLPAAVELERETGFEPAALCLGSRCATIAPLPRSVTVAALMVLVKLSSADKPVYHEDTRARRPYITLVPSCLRGKTLTPGAAGGCGRRRGSHGRRRSSAGLARRRPPGGLRVTRR